MSKRRTKQMILSFCEKRRRLTSFGSWGPCSGKCETQMVGKQIVSASTFEEDFLAGCVSEEQLGNIYFIVYEDFVFATSPWRSATVSVQGHLGENS
eukprot:scaffold4026_cov117-Cylindrotheca_fusiformis.AAC.23